jgi:hypothetical protein
METRAFTDIMVAAAIAVGEAWDGMEVGLFGAPFTPNPESVLADLTEMAFTGYARVALTPATGPVNPESAGTSAADWPRAIFTNTDALFNGVAYGWFIADVATHNILYAAASFPTPIPITGAGASVSVVMQGQLDPESAMFNEVSQ